ncbi:Pkinase-domain-containing protein [Pluteus cervinus]|uniref:Pkinase-domain-containing protein n=1 Tax=Pluteus cervinus TaxID=181527 RepID=A0ACD3B641_9AGAR|nr:Pkinase-domain-containing protein [Pluteus cervinus]
MSQISSSPPRAPPVKYVAPLGTRWAKEKAAAGGSSAFDLPSDPKRLGPWILGECIGKGASGRVKLAKHHLTGQLAAVKILPVAPLVNSRASLATQQAKTDKQRLGIDREITMMKLMNHPNIMRIYDVYEGDKELFLVLEYVEGGELFDYLVNRGRLPPEEALVYFKQIIYGLNYAHTFSIIHRDLKPENILIASLSPPSVKIADWGMAAFAPPSFQLETSCGSPHYASPEIVNGEKYEGNATDIWSCGVILFALLTGRLPFDDKNVRALLVKVKSGKYDIPSWMDPLAKDLLSRMLIVDVNKRITVPDILAHPWLKASSTPSSIPKALGDPLLRDIPDPPLPPSPSTLARPIASAAQIDPELLSSLRIIWGRHADPNGESIKRELCSPAGCGIYAKAFYFLLGKYRDESLQKNGESTKDDVDGNSSTRKLNLNWEMDLANPSRRNTAGTGYLLAPSGYGRTRTRSSAPAPYIAPAPPAMSRTRTSASSASSRERPASPAGPRPLSQLPRKVAQQDLPVRPNSTLVPRGIPRPAPRRGHTYSHPLPSPLGEKSLSPPPPYALPLPRPRPVLRPHTVDITRTVRTSSQPTTPITPGPENDRSMPSTPFGANFKYPQSPRPTSNNHADICMDLGPDLLLQPLIAPRTDNRTLQRTMDQITERVNGILDEMERTQSRPDSIISPTREGLPLPPVSPSPAAQPTNPMGPRPRVDQNDKENVTTEDHGARRASNGAGLARDVGREMRNVVYLGEGLTISKNSKTDKDFKGKSLAEHASYASRRSTVASPISLSVPPSSTTTSHRLLASPVIGEFKGWFSNLFNWRSQNASQSGVFYSSDDIPTTRMAVGRLLESMGVVVEETDFNIIEGNFQDRPASLRCKVEENSADGTLKPVKFRIEFTTSSIPGSPVPESSRTTTPIQYSRLPMPSISYTSKPRSIASSRMSTPHPLMTSTPKIRPLCASAIILVHERGSLSTFRTIWRQLKAAYSMEGSAAACPTLSPAIAHTPLTESHQRFSA